MFLHVANGHSATELIERSGLRGRTMVWCDPLYEGPVPGHLSDEELVRLRAEFLAPTADAVGDLQSALAGWRAAVDDTSAYDELVLWFEHDLFDQLNLIQLLAHLGRRQPWPTPVSLISIDRHEGHPDFRGLGELTPAEIAALFPQRVPITPGEVALATRAWAAFRSPDPGAIVDLLRSDTSALPFLAGALARHLEEFPSERDGLSRSERQLMSLAISGAADLQALLSRMHDGEHWYYATDTMLLDRARALASTSPALLTLSGGGGGGSSATITLTADGRDVLRGAADRVRLCGIDRWLGGVHLRGGGPLWRWSAGKLTPS